MARMWRKRSRAFARHSGLLPAAAGYCPRRRGRWVSGLLALMVLCAPARAASKHGGEVRLSDDEFKRLDTFEAHTLSKADKVFVAGDHKRAAAEYDSFILEFPRSKAIPYALLRKGRCLQLADKRFEAAKQYQEVLDYFPNAVKFAAAALFYIGECHWENGDEEKAMKAWARMAEDVNYSKHYLAATAVNRLADHLAKERPEKAAEYYMQVAVDFRGANQGAAREAIGKVVAYYVRTQPDEPKLRAFYKKVGTFGRDWHKVADDIEKSRRYWSTLLHRVKAHGSFKDAQAELRDRYYRYWSQQLDGKFPDWDSFQIDVARLKRVYEKDDARWMERLDAQFQRYQTAGDYGRVVRWIRLYARHKPKMMEYYNKLRFDKMANARTRELMAALFDEVGDAKMARNVFGKIRLDETSDSEKAGLAHYLYRKDGLLVRDVCVTFEDQELGQAELLRYYHFARDAKKGVPQADKVAAFPRFAQEALFKKAQILHWSKQFRPAVAAYQQADCPPANLWGIADCFAKLGQLERAVAQLREVEAFFSDHAPEAALRIARLYKQARKQKLCIAAFRAVLKKYPESRQSSSAHEELERMGIKIGGGVDAD